MKFTKEREGVFTALEKHDAREGEIAFSMDAIERLVEGIKQCGISPDIRAEDRAGHWRYSEVERSLLQIRDFANAALEQIALIDFAENAAPNATTSSH